MFAFVACGSRARRHGPKKKCRPPSVELTDALVAAARAAGVARAAIITPGKTLNKRLHKSALTTTDNGKVWECIFAGHASL